MGGAYTTLEELVSLRFLSKRLPAPSSRTSYSTLSGTHISPFKGRGIDFEEVRIYQPGDDIRSIDWRVTARRSKPHTKIFSEEKEKPTFVITDQSHSMFFGSTLNFKSVTAAHASSLFIWNTLLKGDRIGGLIFKENELHEIKPQRSKKTAMRLIKQMVSFNQTLSLKTIAKQLTSGYLTKALRHAKRIIMPGTTIFIISDFKDINLEALRYLAYLSKHNEILALRIVDPLEEDLPKPGFYTITNGTHKQQINTHDHKFRNAYRKQETQFADSLQEQFTRYKIRLITLNTSQPTSDQLVTRKHGPHGSTAKHS